MTLSALVQVVRRRGPTRREVIAGSFAAGVAASRAAASGVQWTLVNGDLHLRFDALSWVLRASAFGLTALPQPSTSSDGLRLSIPSVNWPGTRVGFDLDLDFRRDKSGWTLASSTRRLAASMKVSLDSFLAGHADASWRLADSDAGALASAVGWRLTGANAQLSLTSDQTWRLSATGGLVEPESLVRAQAINIRANAARGGPLDSLLGAPDLPSTSATADMVRSRRAVRINCGATLAQRAVTLHAKQIAEVVRQAWSNDQAARALVGNWVLKVADDREAPGGKFESVHGLVALSGDGRDVIAALPLPDEVQVVPLDGAAIGLCGGQEDHRIDLRARDGVVRRCEVKALVTHLAVRVPGADFSQLEFDGETVIMLLHGGRSLAETLGFGFSLNRFGRWQVPLAKARLRLARAEDLLSVTLSFKDLILQRRWGCWALELAPGGTAPVLAAEFPPQHVLEQAYLRIIDQVGQPVINPVVPADLNTLRNPDNTRMSPAQSAAEVHRRDPDAPGQPAPAQETFDEVVEARLSAPSRIAFALPLNRKKTDLEPPIEVTLEALTRWEHLEPVVAPRARATLRSVRPGRKGPSGKPGVETDPAKVLADHGITPRATLAQRWSEILGDVRAPRDFETAIELPARLVLSPDQGARFTAAPLTRHNGAVPLWTVRMSIDPGRGVGDIRAIWSPDFEPEAFNPTIAGQFKSVDRGTGTPWNEDIQPHRKLRLPMSSNDRHELVALSTLYGLPTLPRTTPLATAPTPGAPPSGADEVAASNIAPPANYGLAELEDEQGVYIPPAMQAAGLSLSALGGSLDIDGRFEPPAGPYVKNVPNSPLWPALTVETWRQQTVLGRDDFVEVVYKGYLFPYGHRASLVKRTERYIRPGPIDQSPAAYLVQRYFIRITIPERIYPRIGQPYDGRDFPVKVATFKTTRTPDIQDPTDSTGAVDANGIYPSGAIDLHLPPGAYIGGLVFWPRTDLWPGAEVNFQIEADGGTGTMSLPLIFADNTAAHDPNTMSALVDYYEGLTQASGLTTVLWNGQARPYAPARKPGATTFETARWILGARGRIDRRDGPFRMDAAMEGADQPPFYPRVREAHVLLKTLQQFSGRGGDHAVVSFDDTYVRSGLTTNANPAQLYLGIHGYLQTGAWRPDLEPVRMTMQGQGDRSGGVAQPNIWAVNMSADLGPVGGQAAPPRRPDGPSPLNAVCQVPSGSGAPSAAGARSGSLIGADYFPFDATLLGLLNLKDLVKTALIAAAPKLLAQASAAEDEAVQQLTDLLTDLRPKLDAALTVLTASLLSIDQGLAAEVSPGVTGAGLYPRVEAAVAGLRSRSANLRAAVDGGGDPVDRIQAIVAAVQDFNAAVGDLTAELDRVANNPTPDVLIAFRNSVLAVVRAIQTRDFAALMLTPLGALAVGWLSGFCKDTLATWRSTAFGPQVDEQCATPNKLTTLDGFLASVAEVAAEALCYEAVGRPVIQALSTAKHLQLEVQNGAAKDLRILTNLGLDFTARCSDAVMSATQGPLLQLSAQVAAACSGALGALTTTVTGAGTGLAATITVLEADLTAVETALDGFADVETATAAALAQASVTLETARRLSAASPADAALAAALKSVEQAYGQLQAAANGASRLRTGAASAIDRLKGTLQVIALEQKAFDDIRNDILAACPTSQQACRLMDSASRWMNLRLRAIADVQVIFTRAGEAFGVQLPTVQPPIAAHVFAGQRPVDSLNPYQTAGAIVTAAETTITHSATQASVLLAAAGSLLKDLTTLRDTTIVQNVGALGTAYAAVLGNSGDAAGQGRLATRVAAFNSDAATVASALHDATTTIAGVAASPTAPQAFRLALQSALTAVAQVGAFARDGERGLVGVLLGPMMLVSNDADTMAKALVKAGCETLLTVLQPIRDIHFDVLAAWKALIGSLSQQTIDEIRLVLQAPLGDLLDATTPGCLYLRLTADLARLDALLAQLTLKTPVGLRAAQVDLELWRVGIDAFAAAPHAQNTTGYPALALVAQQLGQVFDSLTQGRLQDVFDVAKVRSTLEAALLDVALPRLTINYGFETDINDLPPFFSMVSDAGVRADCDGDPDAKDLKLGFELTIDLKNGGQRHLSAKGELQPFVVNVFEVVTLTFRKAVFLAEDGRTPQVDIKVAASELGAAVEFIEALSSYLSPAGGSGFFVNIDIDPPGVEAGFFLDLGTISIGTVSFANIAFGASVELPFDNRPALFSFYFASAAAPFLIFCSPYGGGGFLKLTSDSRSLVGFEAAFQFGGGGAFSAGPLTGEGFVMTGIHIARSGESASLSGYFMAAGSAHIACFGISACLMVGIEQKSSTGNLVGFATYTFSFSLGLCDVSYSVNVQRNIAKGFGGGSSHGGTATLRDLKRFPMIGSQALKPFLQGGRPTAEPAFLESDTHAMNEDWEAYQSYFDGSL